MKIVIDRVWAMPNKKTFQIKPIAQLLKEEIPVNSVVIDPFPFDYIEDATDYLNRIDDNSYDYAVFDPPYSPRQLKECYKGKGEYNTKSSTWSNWKDLLSSKIKVGGKIISFGWSSQGMGMSRGFQLQRILLVAHGGQHNDTIVTVEIKTTLNIEEVSHE